MTPEVQDLVRRLDQCRRLPRGEQVVFEREFIDQLHAALEALSASRAAPTDDAVMMTPDKVIDGLKWMERKWRYLSCDRGFALRYIEPAIALLERLSAAPTDEEVETAAREAYEDMCASDGWDLHAEWGLLTEADRAFWRRTVTRFAGRGGDAAAIDAAWARGMEEAAGIADGKASNWNCFDAGREAYAAEETAAAIRSAITARRPDDNLETGA